MGGVGRRGGEGEADGGDPRPERTACLSRTDSRLPSGTSAEGATEGEGYVPDIEWDNSNFAETADTVGVVYTFSLAFVNLDDDTTGSSHMATTSVSCCGATAGLSFYNSYAPGTPGPWTVPSGWADGAKTVGQAWLNAHSTAFRVVLKVLRGYVAVPGGATPGPDDAVYLAVGGVRQNVVPDIFVYDGVTEWVLGGSFVLVNVVCKGHLGAPPQEDRNAIRSWHDRRGQYLLFADGTTRITANLDSATATGDYTWSTGDDGELIIGGAASQLTAVIAYTRNVALNTSYAEVRALKCGNVNADLDMSNCLFWSNDEGAAWTAGLTDPLSPAATWKFDGTSGDIKLHRIGSGTAASGAATCLIEGPLRYNLIPSRFAAGLAFALATGWSAYTGLNLYYGEGQYDFAPVYLGAGLSDWYTMTWWCYDTLTNRVKTGENYFDFGFAGCQVKQEWLDANHEDLYADAAQNNRYGMVVLPSIEDTLDTAAPYWGPAVTLAWAAKIVDSDATRQSSWAAVTGVTVDGGHNGWWTAGAGGGSITRALQTRYFVRCNYVQGHVPEGGWWNGDFVLWLKANAIPDLDDLPAAVTACPTEDVTNYDNSGFLVAAFSEWPEAAEGLAVDLTIGYSTVDVDDPCYTCATHRYMAPDGEWTYARTQRTFSFPGVLAADGTVTWDLGYLTRSNTISLQHVDSLRVALPAAAGLYKLSSITLVRDPGGPAPWRPTGTYAEGRIDVYEGVDCSGVCDEFTQRLMEAKFDAVFPSGWAGMDLEEQIAALPTQVGWRETANWSALFPGSIPVAMEIGEPVAHTGVVHSVDGDIWYAYSNLNEDLLGHFEQLVPAEYSELMGYFYQNVAGNGDALSSQAAIAPWKFLADFCGFGSTVDGVTHRNLPYGYEQFDVGERGMKQTQFVQHCPESPLTDDPTAAKALSRLVNELNWQEQHTATYETAAVDAATLDADSHRLGGLFWWDADRGTGDNLTGDAAICVRRIRGISGIPFVPLTVNAYWTGSGRAHGLELSGTDRVRGDGTSSDDPDAGAHQVERREAGTTGAWEACGSYTADEHGRWRTPPLPEAFYEYRVRSTGLGAITTREYTLGVVSWGYRRNPHMQRGLGGLIFRVYQDGSGATGNIVGDWCDAGPPGTWTPFPTGPLAGAYRNPFIAEEDCGWLLVSAWNTVTGDTDFARSKDRGHTWAAVT